MATAHFDIEIRSNPKKRLVEAHIRLPGDPPLFLAAVSLGAWRRDDKVADLFHQFVTDAAAAMVEATGGRVEKVELIDHAQRG